MSGPVRVRRLSRDDASLARTVVRAMGSATHPRAAEVAHLREFLVRPENVLIVATRAEEPLGFLLAYTLARIDRSEPMVCLYEIEVVASERRRGVGRAMIEELSRHADSIGAVKTWGVTQRSNRPARELFASTGASIDPAGEDLVFTYEG